jgi:protein disulfide-isomerase
MKKFTIIFLIFLFIMPIMLFSKQQGKKAATPTLTWLTDFDQAKTVAQAHKVPILINFTGSDWCIWCKRLSSEVFEQKAFNDYAKKNLVLLKIDFPRSIKQTETEKRKNHDLAQQFNIEGYPTIILTDASGKEINRLGYEPGGPVKYVNHLKELLTKQPK